MPCRLSSQYLYVSQVRVGFRFHSYASWQGSLSNHHCFAGAQTCSLAEELKKYGFFCLGIKTRETIVNYYQLFPRIQGTCKRYALFLSATQGDASTSDNSIWISVSTDGDGRSECVYTPCESVKAAMS